MTRIPESEQYDFLLDRKKLGALIDNILINKTLALEARDRKLDQLPKVQAEIRNQVDRVLAKHRGLQVQDSTPKLDYLARAREVYIANPERFTIPERYHVWHALVTIGPRSEQEAAKRAEELRQRVLAGEDLARIAVENSDDPSAKINKGDLGDTDLKSFDATFRGKVLGRAKGDVLPVFKTSFGFHVVKLLDHTPKKVIPFEVAKVELVHDAQIAHLRTVWDEYVRKIRDDQKLFVDTEALEQLRPRLPEIPKSTNQTVNPPAKSAETAR
jgi:peptidyl-prolyl cis-trans isomerase C